MPCYRRSPPKLSVSALNSVRGAQYYANYSARYVVGSKPTPRAKPKPVTPDPALQKLLNRASDKCGGNGINVATLGDILRSFGYDGSKPMSDKGHQLALSNAAQDKSFSNKNINGLAKAIAGGDLGALKKALAARPSYDRQMWSDLQSAAETGNGITKVELAKIAADHTSEGPRDLLTDGEKATLKRAVEKGMFATKKGAATAKQIAKGAPVSILGIRNL